MKSNDNNHSGNKQYQQQQRKGCHQCLNDQLLRRNDDEEESDQSAAVVISQNPSKPESKESDSSNSNQSSSSSSSSSSALNSQQSNIQQQQYQVEDLILYIFNNKANVNELIDYINGMCSLDARQSYCRFLTSPDSYNQILIAFELIDKAKQQQQQQYYAQHSSNGFLNDSNSSNKSSTAADRTVLSEGSQQSELISNLNTSDMNWSLEAIQNTESNKNRSSNQTNPINTNQIVQQQQQQPTISLVSYKNNRLLMKIIILKQIDSSKTVPISLGSKSNINKITRKLLRRNKWSIQVNTTKYYRDHLLQSNTVINLMNEGGREPQVNK
ncbi:hypothetical protein ABPG72_009462 [Tetrahymena utriculariae]